MQNTVVNPVPEIQVPLNVRAPLRGGVVLGLVGTILLGLGVCALSGIDVLDMSIETAKVLCGAGAGSMVVAAGLVKYGLFGRAGTSVGNGVLLNAGLRFDGSNYNSEMAALWRNPSLSLSASIPLAVNWYFNANAGLKEFS